MTATDTETTTYTKKYVLFLDVLGFTNKVLNSSGNEHLASNIHAVLKQIQQTFKNQVKGVDTFQLTFFSDSLYLTAEEQSDGEGNFFSILDVSSFVINDFLNEGFFVRGALTCGDCYHHNDICFGPAVVAAYSLEERIAQWPRVIVDPAAVLSGLRQPGHNRPDDQAGYIDNLIRDDGEYFFVDSLAAWENYIDIDGEYEEMLNIVKENIINNLASCQDQHIRSKYEYFARYFNETLDRLDQSHHLPPRIEKISEAEIDPEATTFILAQRLLRNSHKSQQ
jgi:hypothetical protein